MSKFICSQLLAQPRLLNNTYLQLMDDSSPSFGLSQNDVLQYIDNNSIIFKPGKIYIYSAFYNKKSP